MSLKIEYNVTSEGFDGYFDQLMVNATEEQREQIPREVFFKFRKSKDGSYIQAGKTGFLEKLGLLWKVFKKDIYIFVRDDENGITADDFRQWEKEEKLRRYNQENAKDLMVKAEFVLGAHDICDGLHFRRMLGASPMYKFLTAYRGKNETMNQHIRSGARALCKMLIHYEGSKKMMGREMNLSIPEWYVMLHFSDGLEKKGSLVYSGMYFNAYNASQAQMLRAMKRMTESGYLQKFGSTAKATYRITPLGTDLVYKVLTKHILNF